MPAFRPSPMRQPTFSTDADRLSQDLILKHLHAAFPSDALCAEETTEAFADVRQNRFENLDCRSHRRHAWLCS